MARPIKHNADYFSHDKEMRNDPKIKYIRSKYGLQGYGLYCMILEYLTGCEKFEANMGKMEKILLAGDFGVEVEFLETFLHDAVEVGLFLQKGEKIFSNGLKNRLNQVVEKKKKMQENAMKRWNAKAYENNAIAYEDNAIAQKNNAIAEFSPQKTMQIKENKIKEKENIKEKSFCFDFFIKKFPKQTYIMEAEKIFSELTEAEKAEIEKVYGFWLAYWSSIDVKFVPNPFTWLKSKGWKQKIPEKFGNVATTQSITPKARSDPPKNQEEKILKNEKDERERILQFFREKLDEETREKIEKQADKKFAESPVKKWDLLYSIEIARITKQFIF